MTANGANSQVFLISLILSFLQMGILAFTITLFVLHRKRIKEFYRTGLLLGAICFACNLPLLIILAGSMDFQAMLPAGSQFGPGMADFVRVFVMAAYIVGSVIGVGVFMFNYVIAAVEWGTVGRPRPFPILMRTGEKAWGKAGIAALAGAVGAVVSLVIGKLLNVREGVIFQMQKELLKGFETLPAAAQFLLLLLFVSSAAVTEEILYRGAIFGFLCRIAKNRTAWLLAAIFGVSLVWALMHLLNTDNPAFKLGQIFIFGTILAEFARRWSLESAIAAHLSLNVTALVLGYSGLF